MNPLFGLFGFGGFELLLIIPVLLISLVGTILWIWALVDCATNEPSHGN